MHSNELVVQDARVPQLSNLNDLVNRFLSSQDVRESSRSTYRKTLRIFLDWLGQRDGQNFRPDRDTILRYKEFLGTKGLSNLSVSGYLVSVRQFFKWAEGLKLYPNIANGVKGAKRVRSFRKDALTSVQVKHLLAQIDTTTLIGQRDLAMLLLMAVTGLRTIEVARADLGDIKTEQGQMVLYVMGKGRDAKDELVVLPEMVVTVLRHYLKTRGATAADEPLFTSESDRNSHGRLTTRSISGICKSRLRGADMNSSRMTAHSLRHTAVTLALEAGASLQDASSMARHASVTTTQIYAHNMDRIKKAPELLVAELLK